MARSDRERRIAKITQEYRESQTLGECIKIARTSAGLTQEELSSLTGIHPALISRYETGALSGSGMTLVMAYKLSQRLNVPLVKLAKLAQKEKLSASKEKEEQND